MAFILPGDPVVKDPTKASLAAAWNDALADLNSRLSAFEGAALPNGSFEFDLDVDGEPDNWTVTDSDGGSHSISDLNDSAGNARHGAKSLLIVTNGTGGRAEALSDTFIPCGEDNVINTMMLFQRDTASIRARLQVLYYDETETIAATDTIYDDASVGTGWNIIARTSTVPSGAYFYKIKAVGGESGGGTVAGNIYFDGIAATQLIQELFTVGEYIWGEDPNAKTENTGTPTKNYEIIVPKNGDLKIDFTLQNPGGGGSAVGRIYKNGVAIGTTRTAAAGVTTTFTENIAAWGVGDLCQLYLWQTGATTSIGSLFKLKSSADSLGGLVARLDI